MVRIALISILSLFIQLISGQSIYEGLNHKNFRENEKLQQKIDPEDFNTELLNAAIFFATNEIRVKNKLSVLNYNSLLEKAATIHSKNMAKNDFFDHTNRKSRKYREPKDRAIAAGISNPKIAENIIEGFLLVYKSGESVIPKDKGAFIDPKTREQLPFQTYLSLTDQLMETWMNSKGHRANILSDKAIELGCGTTLYYMTEFNDMPAVKATQNFQWFYPVSVK